MIPARVLEALREAILGHWTGQLQLDFRDGRIKNIGRLDRERLEDEGS